MKVYNISRAQALSLNKDNAKVEPCWIISINDSATELSEAIIALDEALPNSHFTGEVFLDVDTDSPRAITAEQADHIARAVAQAHAKGLPILCHCWAGVSRSAAVALFAHDLFGYELGNITANYKLYNKRVYQRLHDAWENILRQQEI